MTDHISRLKAAQSAVRQQKAFGCFDATAQPRIQQAVEAIRAAKERLQKSELRVQMQRERFAASLLADSDG